MRSLYKRARHRAGSSVGGGDIRLPPCLSGPCSGLSHGTEREGESPNCCWPCGFCLTVVLLEENSMLASYV